MRFERMIAPPPKGGTVLAIFNILHVELGAYISG